MRSGDLRAHALHDQRETKRRLDGRFRALHEGTLFGMEQKKTIPPEEHKEIREEAIDAHEGDKKLDDYDKEVADSFPASDPPAVP